MLVGRFSGLAVMIFRGGILAGDSNWPLDRHNWSLAYLNKYRLSILTRTPIVPTMVELRVKYFERGGFRAQWVSNAVNFEPYVFVKTVQIYGLASFWALHYCKGFVFAGAVET